jgi:LDH2 family malate/lactate/ureidoglycolate dehydrogenase
MQARGDIEKLPSRSSRRSQRWNANRKLGQAVAYEAMDECMRLADEYGTGTSRWTMRSTTSGAADM